MEQEENIGGGKAKEKKDTVVRLTVEKPKENNLKGRKNKFKKRAKKTDKKKATEKGTTQEVTGEQLLAMALKIAQNSQQLTGWMSAVRRLNPKILVTQPEQGSIALRTLRKSNPIHK